MNRENPYEHEAEAYRLAHNHWSRMGNAAMVELSIERWHKLRAKAIFWDKARVATERLCLEAQAKVARRWAR